MNQKTKTDEFDDFSKIKSEYRLKTASASGSKWSGYSVIQVTLVEKIAIGYRHEDTAYTRKVWESGKYIIGSTDMSYGYRVLDAAKELVAKLNAEKINARDAYYMLAESEQSA